MGGIMLLVLRVVVYEVALGFLLVLLPLRWALGGGTRLGIMAEWVQGPGLLLALAGFALWLWATVELVRIGRGTPLPLDPPKWLVTTGPYARIRNPMHVGLVALLLGVGLLFRSPAYLLYALGVVALVWAYARWVEDPSLERRFGDEYRVYRGRVPGWLPRRQRPARPRSLAGPG
jgi:protein-S-isoprenylcysteine O-methyltransferase Ste14